MTASRPVQEYFAIGDVCQLTDLKPHVLRYWESQFRFLNPAKNRSGNRVYQRREIELIIGDQTVTARAGATALVPKEAVHAFSNPGSQRSVLLIMFCPADSREKYFEGLAELTKGGQRPDPQALLELMRKYDTEPVAEPVYD